VALAYPVLDNSAAQDQVPTIRVTGANFGEDLVQGFKQSVKSMRPTSGGASRGGVKQRNRKNIAGERDMIAVGAAKRRASIAQVSSMAAHLRQAAALDVSVAFLRSNDYDCHVYTLDATRTLYI
jgi:hypothetical protein